METLKIVCNKHNQCVADAVEKLQRNAEIIDVVMICDGHYFFLHKLVLAASSTFFESILKDVPTTKSPQLIHLVDYPLEDARLLVELMYRGQIMATNSQLESLANMSKCLGIKPFVERTTDQLAPEPLLNLICGNCQKSYGEKKAAFKIHIRKCGKEVKSCPECLYSSHSTQHLNRHMATHKKAPIVYRPIKPKLLVQQPAQQFVSAQLPLVSSGIPVILWVQTPYSSEMPQATGLNPSGQQQQSAEKSKQIGQDCKFGFGSPNMTNKHKKRSICIGRILDGVAIFFSFVTRHWDLLNNNEKRLMLKLSDYYFRIATNGMIFVDRVPARLTPAYPQIKKKDPIFSFYRFAERSEQVAPLLEQMRLGLAKKDFIHTQIISKKINVRFFVRKDTHELKLKLFKTIIDIDQHEGSCLSICKHYRAMHSTDVIQQRSGQRRNVFSYVDQMPNKELDLKPTKPIKTVTTGKIYGEVERARLTHTLAQMKEKDGEVIEAANILQKFQVETHASRERREKVELMLEQVKLCLAQKDYFQIISKKISINSFDEKDFHELKLKFYKIMIDVYQHEGSYLSICKHYRATDIIPHSENDRRIMKHHAILYLLLSPFDNEQLDLTHRFLEEKVVDQIPNYTELFKLFVADELINWGTLCQLYETLLRSGEVSDPASDAFIIGTQIGEKRGKALKTRMVEYNIIVMARYYTRITVQRIDVLLDFPTEETEEYPSDLILSKTVSAKVERTPGQSRTFPALFYFAG